LLLLGGRAFGGSLLLPVVEGLFGDHLLSVEDRPVLIFGCKRGKKRKRETRVQYESPSLSSSSLIPSPLSAKRTNAKAHKMAV
jgi:hypothetical protein